MRRRSDQKPAADAVPEGAHSPAASANDKSKSEANKCSVCSKVFTYGNDLRKHLRIHSDERPFPCQHCSLRFRQGGCLKNHIASQHGGVDQFSCFYCAKSFPIKERLRLHMRIHSGEKPYKCALCERTFSRGGQLKQHIVTHNTCRANYFDANDRLKTERKPKHNTVGRKTPNQLSCGFCDQTFERRLLLKKHTKECDKRMTSDGGGGMDVEFTYDCDVCDASFVQNSQLRVHKRMHSGDRPYKCQVCWHSFAHSSVLKLHIRKHTGEKPFQCIVCPETTAFSQLPHLKTHMRTIHGMDKTYRCTGCHSYYKTKNEHQLHTNVCDAMAPAAVAAATNATPPLSPVAALDAHSSKQQTEHLSQMRLCAAVLLKRIATADRLKQLGFEKVLIDNVILAALKKADQPFEADTTALNDAERFCVNVRHFLEWTIPKPILDRFEHKNANIRELLLKLTQTNDRS